MKSGIQTRPAALVRDRPYVFRPLTFLSACLGTLLQCAPCCSAGSRYSASLPSSTAERSTLGYGAANQPGLRRLSLG